MNVFNEPKQIDFEKVGVKGKIFPTEHLTDKAQFLMIETETGHETNIIERECNFCYYVLEGEGYFVMNDERKDFKVDDWW